MATFHAGRVCKSLLQAENAGRLEAQYVSITFGLGLKNVMYQSSMDGAYLNS
jgi:hypothetical protein